MYIYDVCKCCGGAGELDTSKDCEVYDLWETCPVCNGTGEEED